jgi:peptidoglycan hydrolase CwlO-like protein
MSLHYAFPKPALSRQGRVRHITQLRCKAGNNSTDSLNDDSYATPSPHFSASLDDKVNNMKSEMAATKSDMAHLTGKIDNIQSEMAHLNNNLTTQMKSFIETVSAQISVLNANMDSRLDKFENRFLFRMLFAVSSLPRICYILLSNNYEGI